MTETITDLLANGYQLLTGSSGQASDWRVRYARLQAATGRRSWPTPAIQHWDGWIRHQWQLLSDLRRRAGNWPPVVLDDHQERTLWQRVIEQQRDCETLLQRGPTAQQAMAAWRIVQQYPERPPARHQESAEYLAWRDWSDAVAAECRKHGWLTRAELDAQVARAFIDGELQAPAGLLLDGFAHYTPLQERLIEHLEGQGIAVVRDPPWPTAGATLHRVAARDAIDEIRRAAGWALACRRESADAGIRIAVPDNLGVGEGLLRAWREGLRAAGWTRADPVDLVTPNTPPPRLADHPLVCDARLLLELAFSRAALPVETLGRLLRSPFVAGHANEALARARLDLRLREQGELASLARVAELAAEADARDYHAPHLAGLIDDVRAHAAGLRERRRPDQWAHAFAAILQAWGWPGDGRDATVLAVVGQWRDALGKLIQQNRVSGPVGDRLALEILQRILSASEQATAAGLAGGVAFCTHADLPGRRFDCLWVAGLNDDNWPRTARANPFLPYEWQRERGVPLIDAAGELEQARRVTAALRRDTPRLVFSWSAMEDDRKLAPSPLVADLGEPLPEREPGLLPPELGELECYLDDQAPPVPMGESPGGGSSLLKRQSDCPFQAFARQRLAAAAPLFPQPGLDPASRGQILHRVLECFWRDLDGQAGLLALDEAGLAAAIERAVAQALQHHFGAREGALRALEGRRQARLLKGWLELERARPAFRVRDCEASLHGDIAGLPLRLRLDRIDEISGGSGVTVIDYKSSKRALRVWRGPRIEEPQLPLYALLAPAEVAAVAFAVPGLGQSELLGVTRDEQHAGAGLRSVADAYGADGIEDWAALRAHWEADLTALVTEFRTGEARVDPVREGGRDACRYCDLQPLCRIHALQPVDGADDD